MSFELIYFGKNFSLSLISIVLKTKYLVSIVFNWMALICQHLLRESQILNISNFFVVKNLVNNRNYLWIFAFFVLFSGYCIMTGNEGTSYYTFLLLIVFITLILVLPLSKTKFVIISGLDRVLSIFALTLGISIVIGLFYNFEVSFLNSFKLASYFIGVWCLFSMITSMINNKITVYDAMYILIGFSIMMFLSLMLSIVIGGFMSIFGFLSPNLSLDYLYTKGGCSESLNDPNSLDSSQETEKNNNNGNNEDENMEWSGSEEECAYCTAQEKINNRLDDPRLVTTNHNVFATTGNSNVDLTHEEQEAVIKAKNDAVGRTDHAIRKDSSDSDEHNLWGSTGRTANDGDLLSDNIRPQRYESVKNTRNELHSIAAELEQADPHHPG